MEKLIIASFSAFLFVVTTAYAEVGYKKGQVKNMRLHRANLANWEPPLFWFTLEGVTSAGSCPLWHGNVLFVGDSDQAMSFVLATYSSGKELAVRFDDSVKTNGYCTAEYITLGTPAPLN